MIDEYKIQEAAYVWTQDNYGNPVGICAGDLAFFAGAKWALEQSQWTSGCPEDSKHYIFYLEFIVNGKPVFEVITGYIDEANGELYHYNDDWYGASAKEVVRFHMPLPDPPKQ